MTVVSASTLTLRPATNDDVPFLREVYASTRADELAQLPWTDEQKSQFIDHQFNAQLADYLRNDPAARLYVVVAGDDQVGRLFLSECDGEMRVLDIALLPAHQRRGYGYTMLQYVIQQAEDRGLKVVLHVERWNTARTLYERLGFHVVEDNGEDVYLRMERD